MTSEQHPISRRTFIRLGVGVTAATLLANCAPAQPTPTQPAPKPAATTAPATQPTTAPAQPKTSRYKEAPMLAELVKAGKLPAVDERLPENPMVVQPWEKVGKYGGTLYDTDQVGNDYYMLHVFEYTYLVRWTTPDLKVIANLAESFQANDTATEFTFKLRKGIKWSDGTPYTANDWMFWYEDIYMNTELTPAKAVWLTPKGKPVKLEKVDDFTIKFKFESPNGLFLQNLAGPNSRSLNTPKHYLSQFHPKYTPKEKLDQAIKDGNAKDWFSLFSLRANNSRNAALPRLDPWWPTQTPGENTQQAPAPRNPYYFKVDPEGNQLPYIDKCVIQWIEDLQVAMLKKLNGEFDFVRGGSDKEKALYIENQAKGKYHLVDSLSSNMNRVIIALNLCHKDPIKRQIFQNKDFRIGLSYAINRKEMIDVVYQGQGEPWQPCPLKITEFYNEKLAKQYTEYDVKKAEESLDKAGYKKGADGKRLGPDGKPITFVIELFEPAYADPVELIKGYFQKVGVDAQIKQIDRGLYYTRKAANDHDATAYGGDGGLEVLLEPRWYFPFGVESNYAIQWAFWYNKDPRGVNDEPPAPAKQQMELYDQIIGTGDPKKQSELMKKILEIAADQFWAIGTVLPTAGYHIAANNLHNLPKTLYYLWRIPRPPYVIPEQLYFDPLTR